MWCMAVWIPGLDFLIVSRMTLLEGKRAGLLAALGVSSATLMWIISGFFGIHVLFHTVPAAFLLLKIGGGGYLIYLGIRMLITGIKHWNQPYPDAEESNVKGNKDHPFVRGALNNLANPKVPIFASSIFAAAMPKHSSILFGAVTISVLSSITLMWFCFVAVVLGQPTIAAKFHAHRKLMDIGSGLLFIGLGNHFMLMH